MFTLFVTILTFGFTVSICSISWIISHFGQHLKMPYRLFLIFWIWNSKCVFHLAINKVSKLTDLFRTLAIAIWRDCIHLCEYTAWKTETLVCVFIIFWCDICISGILGDHLGRIYIDPFARPGKKSSWTCILGRTANEARKWDKLIYLIGNADDPEQYKDSPLHHTQLESMLFYVSFYSRNVLQPCL